MFPIIGIFFENYGINEYFSYYLSYLSNFFKCFLSHLPAINKISLFLNNRSVNLVNIETHKNIYIDIFAN